MRSVAADRFATMRCKFQIAGVKPEGDVASREKSHDGHGNWTHPKPADRPSPFLIVFRPFAHDQLITTVLLRNVN
jgi:hypothetical protein